MMSADPDNDGKVTIADVTTLIDYLLSGVWSYTPDIPDEPETEMFTVNGVTFNLVTVDGGTFTMGATPEQNDAYEDETPTHQVTLTDYSIGQTEVTQELWQAVMGDNPSYHIGDLNYPVDCVSWNMTQEFISRLNELTGLSFRLPTEAEWEYAARGGRNSKGYKHAGSNSLDTVAWYRENSGDSTHLVGTKKANELGIYDMNGNVWEWTQDWYGLYSSEAQTNPTGPSSGSRKVHRGGCFNNDERYSRVSGKRHYYGPNDYGSGEGFRLAMSPRLILEKDYATVAIGEQVRIGIENGHGHSFNVSYASEYVTCRVEGKSVIITGLKKGTTKVTIIDCNNNAQATLTVVIVKGQTFNVNGVSFTMVNIDGGSFIMGATDEQGSDAYSNENPTHQVTLSDYYIGQTEVTQELWQAIMGNNPSSDKSDMKYPVNNISWNMAQDFINQLNSLTGKSFRLPTEAEWEYAARGGNMSKGFKHAGSNDLNEVAWYGSNSSELLHVVGLKKANELGIYDMNGNVWEWTQDWYGTYSSESQTNPTGPSSGSSKVHRGGCWNNNAQYCRVSGVRHTYPPTVGGTGEGFRLAL
jgi:formylglycine-generating enzyme required for sulfatase activity